MVILVFITLFLEFVGLEKSKERDRQENRVMAELLERALVEAPGKALMQRYFTEEYGARASDQLAKLVSRQSPELRYFTVRISVKRLPAGAFESIITNTYETNIPKYIIALTADPLHAETLLSTGALAEVFVVHRPLDTPFTSSDMPVSIHCIRTSEGHPEIFDRLVFRALTDKQKATVLRTAGITQNFDRFRLFEGVTESGRKAPQGTLERYRVVYRITQEPSYSYAFWVSDRVLHVQSLEIDLSDLGEQVYRNARIHFFLGSITWSSEVKHQNGVWSFPVDTYLVSGQGLLVFWPEPTKKELST